MSLKFTILGCGNSSGTPSVGNYWGACDPNEPKNRRFRCSLAVQSNETTIIIDTGPDFTHQMNKFDISMLDAVFYTHSHGDHCHGIDDLRPLFFRNDKVPILTYGKFDVLQDLEGRFHYLFNGGNNEKFYPPILQSKPFDANAYGQVQIFKDISYIPFEMDHGTCVSVGYRFGELSYCVDVKSLNDKALDVIKGSKIWIVDAAAYDDPDNAVHADLQTIYKYQEYVQCEQVFITSLSPRMDYQSMCKDLPSGFHPAYDGIIL